MSNEEAIAYIKQNCYGDWCEDDWRDAMDMAIKALEQPTHETHPNTLKSLDCIDRQAAIDTAAEYEKQLREILGDENELVEVAKILKHRLIALPSAHPERKKGWLHGREIGREMISDTTVEILYKDWRCSNCGWVWKQSRKPMYRYCPNCGSYNGGDQDG